MLKNLAKAPLIAVFYAALLWFAAAFLPRSAAYAEAVGQFSMPIPGLLLLVLFALVAAAGWAACFHGAQKQGKLLPVWLGVSTLGVLWIAPLLRQFLLGEPSGVMNRSDTLLLFVGNAAATVLTLALAALLYKTPSTELAEEPPRKPGRGAKEPDASGATYKLGVLGLLIRLLVLPLVYFLLYYLSWYFLFWQVDAAREFHGAGEKQNFMGELINILVNNGSEAVITLVVGFVFAAFCLPLLFQLKGKRVLFIIIVTILYLASAVLYLTPNPVTPLPVRIAHLVETGARMLVYGVLTGFLLHTAYQKNLPAPEPEPVPVKKPSSQTQRSVQRPQVKNDAAAAQK